MKARSILSEQHLINENITLTPISVCMHQQQKLYIAGSQVINKKTTCNDKLSLCKKNDPMQRLSKTSGQALTSKEKDLEPFWNEQCQVNASRLLLPTETVLQDSDLILFNGSSKGQEAKSWFSTKVYSLQNKSSQKTYCPYFMSSLLYCMGSEVIKTRLNRIYPTKEQKKIFKKWIDVSRFIYNQTVEKLKKENGKTPNWMSYWKDVIAPELPEWCKDVPFQIKKIAVRDAISALKEGKKRVAKGIIPRFELSFRSKKNPKQSCFIPSSAIKSDGIYPRVSGKGLSYSEPLPMPLMDSRLIMRAGKFYLALPRKETVNVAENQGRSVVSIDPGVRTFHTFYSGDKVGYIGKGDFSRIQRLAFYLDDLISRASKAPSQKRKRMMLAAARMREKIKNLIDELHHKAALFYVKNFDVILLPKFETSQMIGRAGRKIRNKTVRNMLTFSHYKFAQFLKHKAFEYGKIVKYVTEEYTSKTHPLTGEIRNIGGAKRLRIDKNNWIDRDIAGAFNIMLKALGDSPDEFQLVAVNKS